MEIESQSKYEVLYNKPKKIIIGSCGKNGLQLLGWLCYLEDKGILDDIETYCGVSISSIICLLLICGYKIREIINVLIELKIFNDIIYNESNEIISNEPIRRKVNELVINKIGNIPSLYNLYIMTGKYLITSTFNVTDNKGELINPTDYSNISCVDACLFSLNDPFMHQIIYNGKTYIDGSVSNPFPINSLDDGTNNILGIYIMYSFDFNKDIIQKSMKKDCNKKLIYSHFYFYSLTQHTINNICNKLSSRCFVIPVATNVLDNVLSISDIYKLLTRGFNDANSFIIKNLPSQYTTSLVEPTINITNNTLNHNNNNLNILDKMSS